MSCDHGAMPFLILTVWLAYPLSNNGSRQGGSLKEKYCGLNVRLKLDERLGALHEELVVVGGERLSDSPSVCTCPIQINPVIGMSGKSRNRGTPMSLMESQGMH